MVNTLELEVGEGREPGSYAVRVLRSVTGGEPTGTFTLDVEHLLAQRPLIEANLLASSVPARRVTALVEQPVRSMGQQLFDAVFAGPVNGAYRASLSVARERGEDLQVVLRLTAPALGALAWETLYDGETGAYLCRREPLIRHVPAPFTAEALAVAPPLRILGMVSSPRGLPALDVELEQQHLQDALRAHLEAGLIELVWLDDVSWASLHAMLLEQSWHVLHFVGHGGYDTATDEGILAFVGADGRADYVDASSLADLLDEAEPKPRLVVLNSCSSGTAGATDPLSSTAATLVRSGIHAVAAMQFAVSDQAAIAFANGFYTAIAHGRGIDTAVRSGRIGILGINRGTLEWVTPVLYLRGGATHLFTLTPPVTSTVAAGPHRQPVPAGSPPKEDPSAGGSDEPLPSPEPRSVQGRETAPPSPVAPAAPAPVGGKPKRGGLVRVLSVLAAIGVLAVVVLMIRAVMQRQSGQTTTVSTVERTIPATQVWTDMTLRCGSGDTLQIGVSGTVMHEQSATGTVGPDGLTDPYFHQWNVPGLPTANTVAVIGSLDEALPFFVVGSGTTYTCPREGALFLGVNDVGVQNNSGEFNATITKSHSG